MREGKRAILDAEDWKQQAQGPQAGGRPSPSAPGKGWLQDLATVCF